MIGANPHPRPEVDVILPVLDEASSLPWVLQRIPHGMRAIVVDNGSSDGSGEVARAHGALVVVEPRRGFGSACHAGLLAATAPVVAFMDADSSFDPLDLVAICAPVLTGEGYACQCCHPPRLEGHSDTSQGHSDPSIGPGSVIHDVRSPSVVAWSRISS
jgi:glycosyltransferase involved in cell wall biosynthesis